MTMTMMMMTMTQREKEEKEEEVIPSYAGMKLYYGYPMVVR